MLKLLLLVVIVWLVYSLLKKYSRSVAGDEGSEPSASASPEDMVRCAHCGVHLPRSEAILSHDEFFCCEAHCSKHPS